MQSFYHQQRSVSPFFDPVFGPLTSPGNYFTTPALRHSFVICPWSFISHFPPPLTIDPARLFGQHGGHGRTSTTATRQRLRWRLEFPICKLVQRLKTDWRDDHSLPVLLARAQVEALRTASDPEARYRAKWRLVRGLYEVGYNAEKVRELFRLMDWMMHLSEDLSERFRVDLDQLEVELSMPYVTSVERLAKAEGKIEGKREDLKALLEAKFGSLTPDVVQRIQRTDSVEKLSALLLQVLTVGSVDQLNW